MRTSTNTSPLFERPSLEDWLDMADELLEQLDPTYHRPSREYDAEIALERRLVGRD